MLLSFNSIRDGLKSLEKDTNSNWGKMNSNLMLIHCNNFIDVSMGRKKVSFFTRTMGRIFGKVYLKYFEYIKFDIKKYPKNSKTLNEFIPTQSEKSFIDNKNILINNQHKVKKMNNKKIQKFCTICRKYAVILEHRQYSFCQWSHLFKTKYLVDVDFA